MNVTLIGGTGTLGRQLLHKLYRQYLDGCGWVRVFSRGEHAQKELKAAYPSAEFVIGDVRDSEAVSAAVNGSDAVFLLAAIKHVDVAEENPLEAIKTNILGAVNVAKACDAAAVDRCIFSNTDKAVLPITSYGYTKALAQNYLLSRNGQAYTRYSAFNWGNVIASQGSVIPLFVHALKNRQAIRLTDERMTRFWLTADAAADFMLENYKDAPTDRAMIPTGIKAASLVRVAESLARLLGVKDFDVEIMGLRGTEKIHEVLVSTHEHCLRSDTCAQYTDAELDELLKPYV